jgi:hypothetical protein
MSAGLFALGGFFSAAILKIWEGVLASVPTNSVLVLVFF